MPCGAKEAGGVYLPAPTCLRSGTHRQTLGQAGRPRHPQESPFYQLVEGFYPEVFALLLAEGRITEDVVANMRSWKHSGFSVDQSVRLEAGDQEGVQRLIQYFLRCPFSQARMIEVTEAGKVIYKTEHNAVGRFPEPGDEELLAGPSRNFQVFDPLGFPGGGDPAHPGSGQPLGALLRVVFEQDSRPAGPTATGRRPERGFPPAPPRRGRPAKAGRR